MFCKTKTGRALALLGIVWSSTATATAPVTVPDSAGNDGYKAVARFNGALTCTAAFIETSSDPDAPAYVLTNGHCVNDPFFVRSGNAIFLDQTVSFPIEFNYFHDSKDQTIKAAAIRAAYSTMKIMDIAVLETDKTIGELKAAGLTPYPLRSTAPVPGEALIVAGIPGTVGALQLSRCENGTSSDIVERDWHWSGLFANTCGGISGGSSGSPVFDDRKMIVGLINTTNVDSIGETCTSGNPCTIGKKGAVLDKGHNYVVPVAGLTSCFDDAGTFDLNRNGCPLPKPTGVSISDQPSVWYGRNTPQKTWNFKVETENDAPVRVKTVRPDQGRNRCNTPEGYGPAVRPSALNTADQTVDISKDGVLQYCIIAAADKTASEPEVLQVLVDNTPPTLEPPLTFDIVGDHLTFLPAYVEPELVTYELAYGARDEIDCQTAVYRPLKFHVPISVPLAPTKVCVIGADQADNKGPIFEYVYPKDADL